MPVFDISKNCRQLKKVDFNNEKALQNFVENNLENLFGIRFLASEFTTSKNHGGRIDSLGLDENNSPVIIEYKWGEKDNIINQGLFYLDWLVDHTGDFTLLVQNKFGKSIDVNFGSPRVLLIAQTFNKYDQYAINRMAENIELWGYSLYENNLFELKLIASSQAKTATNSSKQISKVDYDNYSVKQHLKNKTDKVKELFYSFQEKIFDLESEQKIQENPRKHYIAYRTNKGFLEIVVQKNSLKLYLAGNLEDPLKKVRDVSNIGHLGVGKNELILNDWGDLEYAWKLAQQSYLQSI